MDKFRILKNQTVTVSGTPQTVTYAVPDAQQTQVGGGAGPVPSPKASSIRTQTLITSIFICNTDATQAADIDVNVSNYDSSSPVVTSLYNTIRTYSRTTVEIPVSLTLKALDELRVVVTQTSGTPAIDVTIFGIEITSGYGPSD